MHVSVCDTYYYTKLLTQDLRKSQSEIKMEYVDVSQEESMFTMTPHCQFDDCDQLVECAQPPRNPTYIVRPILSVIPSLAIYPPEEEEPSSVEMKP